MKKVYSILNDILNIDYDIFKPGNWENWEDTLAIFHRKIENLEKDAKYIIEECISSLRSSDLGLELIKEVSEMDTRENLKEFISDKHDAILKHFIHKIDVIKNEFMVSHNKIF